MPTSPTPRVPTRSPSATALESTFVRNAYNVSDGQPKEFLWACELTKESPNVTWTFCDEDDDLDYISHTLFLRNVVLGVGAIKDERNLVQVETLNYAQSELKVVIASLMLGQAEMCSLDLTFSHGIPATLCLIQGTGPVHIFGQHLVELPWKRDDGDCDYTEGDTTANSESEVETEKAMVTVVARPKSKKRKVSSSATPSKSKRGKLDCPTSTDEEEDEDEEDEDEEDEEEDDEEDDEDDEEDDEDDEDEGDDESMEEEEDEDEDDSPVKKKTKGKTTTKRTPTKSAKSAKSAKSLKTKMKAKAETKAEKLKSKAKAKAKSKSRTK